MHRSRAGVFNTNKDVISQLLNDCTITHVIGRSCTELTLYLEGERSPDGVTKIVLWKVLRHQFSAERRDELNLMTGRGRETEIDTDRIRDGQTDRYKLLEEKIADTKFESV